MIPNKTKGRVKIPARYSKSPDPLSATIGWRYYINDKTEHYWRCSQSGTMYHSLCGKLVTSNRLDGHYSGERCPMCAKIRSYDHQTESRDEE